MRSLIAVGLWVLAPLMGQTPGAPAPTLNLPMPLQAGAPFEAPEDMRDFVRKATHGQATVKAKAQALLRAAFTAEADGGLGIQYDNSRTRTVGEVWLDRRANCLGLTAFFVAACRSMGVEAGFAEAPGVSQWRKVGGLVRHERHMVAVLDNKPVGVFVMDFAPELRKSFYNVVPLGEDKALAMFHSNRAVEQLDAGDISHAFAEAQAGLAASPMVGVAWNVMGVVLRGRGDLAGAEAAFRRSLQVDPLEGAACGNLESLCISQGRTLEAEGYRTLANQLRAKDPYFHAFLAREAIERGDLKLARKEVNTALKIFKREPEFYVLMAQIELKEGDQGDAERALELAKKWASPEEQARMDSKLALIRNPQP
jgi:Flp pilus assembly protein TadD